MGGFHYTFWHVDCVRKHSLNAFSERYQKWCKRHGYIFKQSKAEEVYALAKSAVVLVPASKTTKLLVQEAANQLTGISHSVETYRSEMNRLASQLPEYPRCYGNVWRRRVFWAAVMLVMERKQKRIASFHIFHIVQVSPVILIIVIFCI